MIRDGKKGRSQTEATKQKIREARLGTHASIETRRKMSEMRSGEKNCFYGKKHTDETRKKMTSSQINPAKAGGIPHGNEV